MKKVPKMISTKDLSYICDMFNWHLIAAKKLEVYVAQVEDKECSNQINSLCKMHYSACKTLVNLLESEEQ